jgi:hypothetical protein
MLRLGRITVLLIIVFSSIPLIIRVIGDTYPSPVAILFTYPDGTPCELPCLFGIRPGKTSYKAAIALLKANPLFGEQLAEKGIFEASIDDGYDTIWRGAGIFAGQELRVRLYALEKRKVLAIELHIGTNFTLGEIVNFLGTPQPSLNPFGEGISNHLYFPGRSIAVEVSPVGRRTTAPLLYYRPNANDSVDMISASMPNSADWKLKWCGFTARICK